jgi:hypothetical protein
MDDLRSMTALRILRKMGFFRSQQEIREGFANELAPAPSFDLEFERVEGDGGPEPWFATLTACRLHGKDQTARPTCRSGGPYRL